MDSKTWQRRARRWMRHAEFGFIVPVGMVAAVLSLVFGSISDVSLLLGGGEFVIGFLSKLWYLRVLPGVGALFFFYLVFKARLFAIRLLALVTAIGMGARVVMDLESSQVVHIFAMGRLPLAVIWLFVGWKYGRPPREEAEVPSQANGSTSRQGNEILKI